ncbi:MAG: excinuclease ABC subunit UvrC [Treponema sp.]|jgi:excinuclease ABC subunit C|nr:excinuclease ABC subunit UvrC [Treponema sp.]
MTNQINSENLTENLKKTALDAPTEPGVYIMKDCEGRIIYIGKAKNIRNRVKSYFSGEKDIKTSTLLKHIRSFETIIVANEYEALLLENTLIKQHAPKYNINLKDGKTYPVIRITNEDFPRVFLTRRVIRDNSLYYGPFPNVHGVNIILELIDKLFPLRKCKVIKKKGPCMYYHIGRCMAPCCGKIDAQNYRLHLQRVQKLLCGETDSLIIDLTAKMHEAAKTLQFEHATQLRNAIMAIENLTGEESAVVDQNPEDRDYIAWAAEGLLTTFTVFSMRGGKMTGQNLYRARSAADENESLELFITSYYDPSRLPPVKIYIQNMIKVTGEERERASDPVISEENNNSTLRAQYSTLKEWFREKFGYEPELLQTAEKRHTAILAMARQNAAEDLRKRLKERGAGPALDDLSRILDLDARPERIEGFDIAQLDGKYPVASLISFKNGIPDRKNYRYFRLRSVIGIVDDFEAMREAVRRRYSRLLRENRELPDLILVDGGIGQVNAAKGALDELGVECGLVGLAKREEELWLPGAKEPLALERTSEALKVLQHVRDECHRFATGLNQRLRSKDLFFPVLESVEGIGPKRAAAIMKAYESMENIASAQPREMAEHCRISEEAARAVRAVAKMSLEDRGKLL